MFGSLAPRIPDGETGDRSLWIQFQRTAMEQAVNLSKVKEYQLAPGIIQAVYKVHDTTKPVVFGALRYARDAIDSYRQFAALKNDGLIAPGTRFQVALPTPLAVTAGFIEATSQELVEKAYEIRLLEELQEILDAVPHRELAVQWDVAYEAQTKGHELAEGRIGHRADDHLLAARQHLLYLHAVDARLGIVATRVVDDGGESLLRSLRALDPDHHAAGFRLVQDLR